MDLQAAVAEYKLISFLLMLALGFGLGRYIEARHYRSIRKRERKLNALPAVAAKLPDAYTLLNTAESHLVMGSVVISVDYFKRFVAGLRNLVGGQVRGYEALVDRARREAILRMKEQAYAHRANLVFNVKFETSSISKGRKNAIRSVEVLAYGTALVPVQKEG